MICIVCKSEFLASQIRMICCSHVKEAVKILPQASLINTLINENVRLVFFDAGLFTDTAIFRQRSPETQFVAVASIGDENLVEKSLICGAADFLLRPFTEKGVINCL
ncbi:hypothetical protein [Treponema putidum]|uniref:Response regulator receiver domain-containing protein n=1 Tax=Treponema putidum TaxID=221027 RepID=A0AAE9SI42_9SPIR|nr:hypothetical protein [Treponema putidum]AIN94835.1 hypothetical protein JO40_12850 [Treponema putidum]TWI77178.1 hypothetical protein JM98_01475 [Treponema putidum]UTY28846.1 hypothetical protein E4N76_07490 [Treponema putidum]UTY33705.1 hypothetical protein E4N74_06555 [Treponema putidum]